MTKSNMIQGLLSAYEYALESGPPEERARQFAIWQYRVTRALAVAGMEEERQAWEESAAATHFSPDDGTFPAHAETMKSILLGVLSKLEQTEPSAELFPSVIVEGTRPYIKSIVAQANGCYKYGWYDACAVMIRRLIEVLLIDCFVRHELQAKIKSADGKYYGLEKLISSFINEDSWHVPQSMKKLLPKLQSFKEMGDLAAHGQLITAEKQIDDLSVALSTSFQYLRNLAYPE